MDKGAYTWEVRGVEEEDDEEDGDDERCRISYTTHVRKKAEQQP